MDATFFLQFFGDEIGFVFGTNCKFEVEADQIIDLIFVNGAKDEDGDVDASFAQSDTFLKARDAERIDVGESGSGNGDEAMAVGVGFDGEAETAFANVLPNYSEVFDELCEVNFDPSGMGILIHKWMLANLNLDRSRNSPVFLIYGGEDREGNTKKVKGCAEEGASRTLARSARRDHVYRLDHGNDCNDELYL